MLRLKDRPIAAKIGMVIFGFAVLAASLVAVAVVGFRWNDTHVANALNTQARSLFLAAKGHETAAALQDQALSLVIEQDASQWPVLQKGFADNADALAKLLDDLKPLLDPDDFKFYDPIRADFDLYRASEQRSRDLRQAGNRVDANNQLTHEGGAIFARLNGNLAAMVEKQTHDMDEAAAAAHAMSQNTVIVMILTGLGGLLVTVVGALFLVRAQITRPIRSMTDAMGRLAAGDTSIAVPCTSQKDEIGAMADAVQTFKDAALAKMALEREAHAARQAAEAERARSEAEREAVAAEQATVVDGVAAGLDHLANGNLTFRLISAFGAQYEKLRSDFNGAMDKLQQTMTVVAANADAIRTGSTEIATAADDLSKRTEQQAASLEETAAALDQITATVKKTSDGAIHARDVVSSAKGDAERSGRVVGQSVEAMTAIQASAQKVSQIIGVIDEIAFQTNLLALNAGVEAARAGDAGRGFAVVASEVRALAQRSAEAAKEIKALISTSTGQVAQGVDLVGETGRSLDHIVSQVTEINAIVADIAASAKEQATGLDQVNTAVNQMDQVTQQNAAMVEQSTAASHSLLQETEELARLIGRFQLATEELRPAPARLARAAAPALKVVGRSGAARKPEAAADEHSWQEF